MSPRLVDLSHEIENGMVTYPGLPAPVVSDWLSRDASRARYAPGTTFHIGKIEMVANTGTYVDAPFHRHAGGADIAAFPLETVADLDGLVVRAYVRTGRGLNPSAFGEADVRGKAVLVHTGWDAHWRTEHVRGVGVGHGLNHDGMPRSYGHPADADGDGGAADGGRHGREYSFLHA